MSCMPVTDQNIHMLMRQCVVHQQVFVDYKTQKCINRCCLTTRYKSAGKQICSKTVSLLMQAQTGVLGQTFFLYMLAA